MISKPAAENVIQEALEAHAKTVVAQLTDKEVLASLKEQGIGTLEELVAKSLKGLKAGGLGGGGVVGRDTFIYTQAIYKSSMPIDHDLINQLSKKIGK
jgi:hypothetical protein